MSGLRCWPGATAFISGLSSHIQDANGRVVTLKNEPPVPRGDGVWLWWLAEPITVVATANFTCQGRQYWAGESVLLDGINDARLTPITPPPGTDCTTHDADKPQPVEA